MIRKLRNKLILVSMISLFTVLFLIISLSMAVSYRHLTMEADRTLAVLAGNGGVFPLESGPFKSAPELPFESRFFSVRLTNTGELITANMERIAAVKQDKALDYAREIIASGRTCGFKDVYRYAVQNTSNGSMVLFLDCRRSLESFYSFSLTCVLISLLGMAAVLVLILLFSRRIVKPIAESYEKQRRFITNAGHEIKTPLAIINANTDILEMDLGENEWLTEIKNQTWRLTVLTNDLISLSRMEEAGGNLQMEVFSFSEMTQEAAQSFQAMAASRQQTFSMDIASDLFVRGDRKDLGRLLSILLDNAVKYCPPQGYIHLTLKQTGKYLCLKLTNTAQSIHPSDLPHLFDRFYRTDTSRNSETGGYGIGLSIANAVAGAHKGRISAATEDGTSLTITVLLPAAQHP